MPTILAIDDNQDNLLVLKAILKNLMPNCTLTTVTSGEAGLKSAINEQPDTILLDIKMPGMDGYEVCRLLRSDKKTKHIPIIMLTAVHTDTESRATGLEVGADAFLAKPIEEHELVAQIRAMLRIKQAEDRLRREKEYLAEEVEEKTKDLSLSEATYRAMFENMGNAVVICNAVDSGQDCVVLDLNRAAEKIEQLSRKQLIGKSLHDAFPVACDSGLLVACRRVWESGVSESLHLVLDDKGEKIGWRNYVIYKLPSDEIVVIYSDETKNIQADLAMQALVESIVGATGQACFDRIVSGLCRWLNAECAILGKVDQAEVEAVAMQLDGKEVKGFRYSLEGSPCENVTQKGYHFYPENVRGFFPNDTDLVDLQAEGYVGVPICNRAGEFIGILSCLSRRKMALPDRAEEIMDILAAKAASVIEQQKDEEEKAMLGAQLRQAQKMEAIGTLAGGIAHDFNNMLGTILGYADMAKEDAPKDSGLQNQMDKVLAAGFKARDLVKQILAFSRQEEIERILLKPQYIVKEALKMLRSTIPATIQIKDDISTKCWAILADPTQLHQVIINLCSNAYQAMETTGGILEVKLENTELSRADLKDPSIPAGRFVKLTVKDSGPGMAPDIKERIFDPYFTTKEIGKGTGMGLAVAHGIVMGHDGIIKVDSEVGKGASFQVFFPIVEEEIVQQEEEYTAIPKGTEKILFVDDDELLANMGKDMLERLGYKVTVRGSSLNALREFESQPDGFDLVITDMTMPVMTGAKMAKEILRIRPDMPIIICSGYSNLISEEKAKEIGIKEFAFKPIERRDIANLVRKVLDAR